MAPSLGGWADGRANLKALVIVNEKAGSLGAGDRERLLSQLKALGVHPIKTMSDIRELVERDASGADLVIVLGGDGTARMAAATFSAGPPLVLLPGGTLNVLPHALYGALAWPEALQAALTRGRIARLTGGDANGRKFFVAAMFGAPSLLARARESARLGRLAVMIYRLRLAFNRMLSRRLAVRPAGGVASRAEAVGVLCPAYSGGVEGRSLEWVRLDVARVLDFLRVGLRSVIGGWRDDPTIAISNCSSGEIRSIGIIPAVLDGEPVTFVSKVRIRILSGGPKVLMV